MPIFEDRFLSLKIVIYGSLTALTVRYAFLTNHQDLIKELIHVPFGKELLPIRVFESNEGIDVQFNGYVFDSSDDDDNKDTISASDVGSANEVEHSTNEEGEDSGKGSDAESDNDIGQENTNNSNGTFNIDGLGWSFHPCYAADSLSKERSSSIPGQFPRTNPCVDVPDKLCCPQKDKSTTNNLLSSTYVKSTTKCPKSTLHPYGPSLNSSINPT
ncbi:hypothetical protein Tco_0771761 [Tanacetum coccineum]|uniref:Uncharacterized protein n=1 Tax=Tanacetum coccineum TaxID=301880 RepID=A0ABQ4ZJC7_9ASTR